MKVLVTGANGFIGANVVQALLERGYEVKAFVRRSGNLRALAGLDVETAFGDLRDLSSLDYAMDGCRAVFHVGAVYTFWAPRPQEVFESNVKGTENVLLAARKRGVERVVFTSSESTVGANPAGTPADESRTSCEGELAGAYKKSKLRSELLALEWASKGMPVVVVNPTVPVGSWDTKPTPTGRIVRDFIARKMPAYVNTGLNVVDVRDVAAGHVLALERGRDGERYVLGNANVTMRELMALLEQVTGVPAPTLRIPIWAALAAGYADEMVRGRFLGQEPRVPLDGVRAARKYRFFDCSKSVRELGMPQTPIDEALGEAVRWFREEETARMAARSPRKEGVSP